jgi:hypothetical protein
MIGSLSAAVRYSLADDIAICGYSVASIAVIVLV